LDSTLETLVSLIRSSIPCECVYVHGSRGEGTEDPGRSDYDILAIAGLPSLLSSMGRLPSLRRRVARASSLPVDLTLITPRAASESRNSLLLISWSRKAKLVTGTRDVLRDLNISSMAPDPLSVSYNSGHQAKWLLRYVSMDSSLRVSVDRRGVRKLCEYLEEDIVLGAGSSKGLTDFASSIRAEDQKKNCDLHAISRACAGFLKGMNQQIMDSAPRPFFPSLLSRVSSMAEMRVTRIPGFPPGRKTQTQLVNALMCFYKSMDSDPPDVDLVRRAARSLGSPLGLTDAPASFHSEDEYLLASWNRVRSKIRGNWDSIMGYPFGSVVFHRPFPVVLA
jgi:predicted nucleotidyltransferase